MSAPATRGAVVWFTGLPASGKTTLAGRAHAELTRRGIAAVLLDSDELRLVLAPELGYGARERGEFYRRLAALAGIVARQGAIALVAATAPERRHREAAREAAPRYFEIFVDTGAAECEARDIKGLYRAARAGRAPDLPGVGSEYEVPADPAVVAHGGEDTAALDRIVALCAAGR
jgi:adenylylsulfate kinase